jgi:hypothetical protein
MTANILLEALSLLTDDEKNLSLWIDEDLNESGDPDWDETGGDRGEPLKMESITVEIIRWEKNGKSFVAISSDDCPSLEGQELVRIVWTAPKPEPTLAERIASLTDWQQKALNKMFDTAWFHETLNAWVKHNDNY